jgi:anti-sigma regulatory factor (Ser/Thr protein kinase)
MGFSLRWGPASFHAADDWYVAAPRFSYAISFDVPVSVLAASAARDRLELFRSSWPPSRFEDARLIISELVTNSVRHGPPTAPITIRIEAEADQLRVDVIDRGSGFERPRRRHVASAGGNGLVIVDAIADRWGVRSGSPTTVWFELDLP